MNLHATLQALNDELHISQNQVTTYLNCSLRYQFQYIFNRPRERISISLLFGSAVHGAIEMYLKALKNHTRIEPLKELRQRFEDLLSLELDETQIPIIYKKDLPDKMGAIEMGRSLLKVFHESIDVKPHQILGVELPLMSTLYTEDGNPTEFKLFGVLDLVLKEEAGDIVVVDFKTASKSMAQSTADDDFQMSVYSYLLASNKFVFPTAPVKCRFTLLRKLKAPRLEYVETLRTAWHRKRFAKVANSVLAAIDNQIFMPQTSWMCGDCPYADACKTW
ncbi:MAG: hypothetical protein COS92_04250 [Desulfobacterales bacterium CG07_land_8_20_14_0_80_52_14]|nr:MAG: hypothetical protein COS92_04250 [Desulfobacterales bacterium CG07_land_8_20_14_0_80_52_14]